MAARSSRAPVWRRAALAGLAGLLLAGCTSGHQSSPRPSEPSGSTTRAPSPAAPERSRPGEPGWSRIRVGSQHDIEGYTDLDSVLPGQPVRLFISTVARHVRVRAYRTGWYGGARARLVWQSAELPGRRQPAARVVGPTHTPSAPWRPSLTVDTTGWPAGDYLFRLDTDRGPLRRFVPLTVRTASNRAAVVLVNADTTWEAYNAWGGYSLYHGPDGGRADRSRAVTFDRPYDYGGGTGDFLGAELPLVALAERLGLRLGYATDVDLHRDPTLLDGAAAVISLGHDEYWSPAMRAALTRARDRGTNLAFLGANAIYRKIRFGSTRLGADRLEINYKDTTDPIGRTDPAQVTTQWREPPSDDNESSLTGTDYGCSPVRAPMVVVDPGNWLLAGLGLSTGSRLPGLVGSEYDRVYLGAPTPRPIEVLTHSPLVCDGRADTADAAYYTTLSGAGVFDSGTSDWIAGLDSTTPVVRRVVTAVTTRLLLAFAAGPAGRTHPARDTAARYG
jgi:N,N-dimethylformamidase beta subunit-like, C-terminal